MTEMEMPVLPEGYEYTGEFRPPKLGEFFSGRGDVVEIRKATASPVNFSYPILKKVRVRPGYGTGYYYITDSGTEIVGTTDMRSTQDDSRFNFGNYFLSRDVAIEYKSRIRDVFLSNT